MKFNDNIQINKTIISKDSRVFIIGEAGVNHNGDINIAKKLIDVAVEAGVDAVKFQTFKTENLILKEVEKAKYQKTTTGSNETQFEMLKKLEVTKEENRQLIDYCKTKNITFLSTPFDEESIDQLVNLEVPAFKIASTDLTNLPFLKKIAKCNKPIILSTGMSYFSEVKLALEEIHPFNKNVILLQCTANYPIKDEEANLNVIKTYQKSFDILTGYSDHSIGLGASLYAVPMGVKVVEKHFTINKSGKGPDHLASLNAKELKEYVKEIRRIEQYCGSFEKKPSTAEMQTRKSLQKCLVASDNIKRGDLFTESNMLAKRTGGKGISPIYYKKLLIKKASKNYKNNEIIEEKI